MVAILCCGGLYLENRSQHEHGGLASPLKRANKPCVLPTLFPFPIGFDLPSPVPVFAARAGPASQEDPEVRFLRLENQIRPGFWLLKAGNHVIFNRWLVF